MPPLALVAGLTIGAILLGAARKTASYAERPQAPPRRARRLPIAPSGVRLLRSEADLTAAMARAEASERRLANLAARPTFSTANDAYDETECRCWRTLITRV
jgi:hypothetical protein